MAISSRLTGWKAGAGAGDFLDRDRRLRTSSAGAAVNYKLFEKICLPNGEEGVMLPSHSILSCRDIQRIQPRRLRGKGKGFPLLCASCLILSEK
jgi:hypothetical protein